MFIVDMMLLYEKYTELERYLKKKNHFKSRLFLVYRKYHQVICLLNKSPKF